MNIFLQLFCMAIGYGIGILPTARIITRFVSKKDILLEGSQNAGAMNAYRVSGLWWVGVLTAAIDIAKGFAAVRVGVLINDSTFIAPALCGFFAILGHNYNVLQQMRGGRGLAPAAGVMLGLNPVPLVVFIVCWLTGYFVIRRNMYVGTMAGAIATPILLFNAPEALLTTFMQVHCEKNSMMLTIVFLVCVQILVRHLEPIRALFAEDAHEELKK